MEEIFNGSLVFRTYGNVMYVWCIDKLVKVDQDGYVTGILVRSDYKYTNVKYAYAGYDMLWDGITLSEIAECRHPSILLKGGGV